MLFSPRNDPKMHETSKQVFSRKPPTPFLKWAGGKRWLTQSDTKIVPSCFNTYVEPFLGSGAIFFSLIPKKSILADLNEDLINSYMAIKSNWYRVKELLEEHQRSHSEEHYYYVRSQLPECRYERAARLIYLNRTCWNGLYRVNLKGEFNVPKGSKVAVLMESDNFENTAIHLKKSKILCQDFEITLDMAKEGDFAFIDPPYTVKHNSNGFLKYNENIFSWSDQVRLRESVGKAVERGVMITMSNADHVSIHELYSDLCRIERVARASVLSGKSEFRGTTTEVLLRIGWSNDK